MPKLEQVLRGIRQSQAAGGRQQRQRIPNVSGGSGGPANGVEQKSSGGKT